jgi:hypothetical protein
MAKKTKTQKRRRTQRGGNGYQSHATFHQDPAVAGGLSSARFYPLSETTSPSEWGGISTRIIGGGASKRIISGGKGRRRRRFSTRKRKQRGGGGFATGGIADYHSAYSNGANTTTANTGVQFVSEFPLTNVNTVNGAGITYKMDVPR